MQLSGGIVRRITTKSLRPQNATSAEGVADARRVANPADREVWEVVLGSGLRTSKMPALRVGECVLGYAQASLQAFSTSRTSKNTSRTCGVS